VLWLWLEQGSTKADAAGKAAPPPPKLLAKLAAAVASEVQ
jgi:hypothetical protein